MTTTQKEVRKEQEKDINNLNTLRIVTHLVVRHRTFLWAFAFFVSNTIWLVKYFN